jgi:hypothetical protein
VFLYPSPAEGLAWLEASDEALAAFDVLTFKAARERRKADGPVRAEDPAP